MNESKSPWEERIPKHLSGSVRRGMLPCHIQNEMTNTISYRKSNNFLLELKGILTDYGSKEAKQL